MPSFDSNSRDHLEEDGSGEPKESSAELKSNAGTFKTTAETPLEPQQDNVSDDLEISDSDSSSEIKSREASDKEEVGEKVAKPQDNIRGKEKSKENRECSDFEDNDDYLLYLEDILRTVHKAYYDLHDQSSSPKSSLDLKMVIPYVRKKTLQGVTIVLSGVVPTQVIKKYTHQNIVSMNFATLGSGISLNHDLSLIRCLLSARSHSFWQELWEQRYLPTENIL